MAAATMLLAACATDDDKNDNGKGGEQGQSKFLAVNIMNVGATPTGTHAIDGYEDGTEAESKINKVRFYFFHADGSPYYLQNTSDETTSGTNANWLETVNDINGTCAMSTTKARGWWWCAPPMRKEEPWKGK